MSGRGLLSGCAFARAGVWIVAALVAGCASQPPAPDAMGASALQAALAEFSLERCDEPLGTMAVVEDRPAAAPPADPGPSAAAAATEPVIRQMARWSNCFIVVRTPRPTMAKPAEFPTGADPRPAPDYTVSANLLIAAGLDAWPAGTAPAGPAVPSAASARLLLIENRSGVQVAQVEGSARRGDYKFMGATAGERPALGAAAGPEGPLVTAAVADSYNQLVKAVRSYRAMSITGGLGVGAVGALGHTGGTRGLAGVVARTAAPPAAGGSGTDPGYATVRVHYATNREVLASAPEARRFGSGRARELSYGTAEVSIPRTHRLGALEAPPVLRTLLQDPARHVVVLRLEQKEADRFWADASAQMGAAPGADAALVFVHGYNVSFDDAARRTAQIASDMGYKGVPFFFSWPSGAAVSKYLEDSSNAEWSQPQLERFLVDLLARTRASQVHLVAHSMGTRVLTRAWMSAVRSLSADDRARVKEIVLAAPDIDADVFRGVIAPALVAAGAPVTLYASSADVALQASRQLNGFPRAGDAGDGLVIADGIETIDASDVATDGLGHSYVLDARLMLSDLQSLLVLRHRAAARFGLKEAAGPKGRYWRLMP